MKTTYVVLYIIAIVLNISVLSSALGVWLDIGEGWLQEIVLMSFEDWLLMLVWFLCPIVNLIVLTSKYSMMHKWLVSYFNWNLNKIPLVCMWMGITVILGVIFVVMNYIRYDWAFYVWPWRLEDFAFRVFLVAIIFFGLIITSKNKKSKLEPKQ